MDSGARASRYASARSALENVLDIGRRGSIERLNLMDQIVDRPPHKRNGPKKPFASLLLQRA